MPGDAGPLSCVTVMGRSGVAAAPSPGFVSAPHGLGVLDLRTESWLPNGRISLCVFWCLRHTGPASLAGLRGVWAFGVALCVIVLDRCWFWNEGPWRGGEGAAPGPGCDGAVVPAPSGRLANTCVQQGLARAAPEPGCSSLKLCCPGGRGDASVSVAECLSQVASGAEGDEIHMALGCASHGWLTLL